MYVCFRTQLAMKGRVNSWLNRGKLILQEWEVKIQRLEIWLLVRKVMTHKFWVKDKVHCLAILSALGFDLREKSTSSETISVLPYIKNDSTVLMANLTRSLYSDPTLELAYVLRNILFFIFPQSLYEVPIYSLSKMRI